MLVITPTSVRLHFSCWDKITGWMSVLRFKDREAHDVCSPENCNVCHDGSDICVIVMSKVGQWALPASRCRVGHSSYVSLSNYF